MLQIDQMVGINSIIERELMDTRFVILVSGVLLFIALVVTAGLFL